MIRGGKASDGVGRFELPSCALPTHFLTTRRYAPRFYIASIPSSNVFYLDGMKAAASPRIAHPSLPALGRHRVLEDDTTLRATVSAYGDTPLEANRRHTVECRYFNVLRELLEGDS